MKVLVQVVDTKTGIYQGGLIDEPVIKNKEVANALVHFGIVLESIVIDNISYDDKSMFGYGHSEGTTKKFQFMSV